VDVYFDDVKITHTKSPVIQQDDYYPFGLVFNEYKKENSLGNKYKFQKQEHVEDLDLNWDSFKWRNYQPDICRFFNIDPLAEKYVHNSTYAFSENKVVAHVELEGLESESIKEEEPIKRTVTASFNFSGEARLEGEKGGVAVSAKFNVKTKEVSGGYEGPEGEPREKNEPKENPTTVTNDPKTGAIVVNHQFAGGPRANMTIRAAKQYHNFLKKIEVKFNPVAFQKFVKLNIAPPTLKLGRIPIKVNQANKNDTTKKDK
jgi:RHS repeat-associated protein